MIQYSNKHKDIAHSTKRHSILFYVDVLLLNENVYCLYKNVFMSSWSYYFCLLSEKSGISLSWPEYNGINYIL